MSLLFQKAIIILFVVRLPPTLCENHLNDFHDLFNLEAIQVQALSAMQRNVYENAKMGNPESLNTLGLALSKSTSILGPKDLIRAGYKRFKAFLCVFF